MTTAVTSLPVTRSANSLLRRAWRFSPLLTLAGLAGLALIPLFILAALVDPRTITGAPAWIKPLKFALSIAIFSATFIWLLTFVDRTDGLSADRQSYRPARRVRWIAGITGLALLVEIGLITMQVLPLIAGLMGTPAGAAAGWVHFLAFDLFVGRWAYLDSRERAISAWLVSPTLFFILMAGPLGLLLYLGVRWVWQRRRGQS